MEHKILLVVFAAIFAFGWFCSSAYSNVLSQVAISSPLLGEGGSGNIEAAGSDSSNRYLFNSRELISPYDWVSESQIHIYQDKVVIDLQNPQWAVFTDTNSMDPVFDAGSHAIEVVPESPADIHLGDIVSYNSEHNEGAVIHRVVEIGEDSDGWYCRMKGDNNPFMDPGKVRFEQLQRVLVAVIY